MVTYCVPRMILPCSLVIGQFFDTMIVVSTSWKVLETALNHLMLRDPRELGALEYCNNYTHEIQL